MPLFGGFQGRPKEKRHFRKIQPYKDQPPMANLNQAPSGRWSPIAGKAAVLLAVKAQQIPGLSTEPSAWRVVEMGLRAFLATSGNHTWGPTM